MLDALAWVVIDGGLQSIGWAVLKVITFGRYRSVQPDNMLFEGLLGATTVFIVCYGVYRWVS